jgi:hypothetical protein
MALKHINPKPSLMGSQLNLTDEQKKNCKVLYKHIKNGLHEFAGIYNPDILDEEYPDGIIALPVASVYNRMELLKENLVIYNVEGSTKDPWYNEDYQHHKPWIKIWEGKIKKEGYNDKTECYVNGSGAECKGWIIGGHIVLDESEIKPTEKYPVEDIDAVVYIVPICNSHNHRSGGMTLCKDVHAMLMDKYFQYTDYPDPDPDDPDSDDT